RTGFAVAFALFLFVVPGVLLAVRWALAAPVVMLEGLCARDAMRRSGELVRGHRGAVFRVLLNVWVRVAIAWFVLDRIIVHLSGTMGHPLLSFWIGGALASAVVTPYAGHALSVVYYRLTQPDLPVIPQRGRPGSPSGRSTTCAATTRRADRSKLVGGDTRPRDRGTHRPARLGRGGTRDTPHPHPGRRADEDQRSRAGESEAAAHPRAG